MNKDLKKILITEDDLQARAKEIGQMIDQKHGEDEIVLVGLLKGSYVFTADVARNIKNPNVLVEFIVVSSYANDTSNGVKIILDFKKSIEGKKIIIVEDIIDTGHTLSKMKADLLGRGAKSVEIASMCSKPSRNEVPVDVDYPLFILPDEFVVGYGLDYNEHYRHLPYVAALTEKFIEDNKN